MVESHQAPQQQQQQQHPQPPPPHLQQGAPSWYPNPYSQFQNHHPLPQYLHQHHQQQQHNVHWSSAPSSDQPNHYPQPQPYQQPDFYSQPQRYTVPQSGPPQFTYMHAQQDQVWPMNTGWGYQQCAYPGFTPEEDWAAKARAWAASKAALDSTSQPSSSVHETYQNYQPQDTQLLQHLEKSQSSLNPPGQDAALVTNDNAMNQAPKVHTKIVEQPVSTVTLEHSSDNSGQKSASGLVQAQSNNSQVVPSCYSLDVASSVGQENPIAASLGIEIQESTPQQALQQPPTPIFSQQQSQFLQQIQVPAHPQQQQFSYNEPPLSTTYEYHPQQQVEFQQQSPQNFQQHQQYRSSVLPTIMEGPEADFGMPSSSIQNWPPMGGPGMPFPPVMGAVIAGSPQFEHPPSLHPPHQIAGSQPPIFGRPHGLQQSMGFPPAGTGLGGPFGFGGNLPLVSGPGGPMFIPDGNGSLGFPERQKKAAVPSWLREELMKKKAAGLTGGSAGALTSEESTRTNGGHATQLTDRHGVSDSMRESSPGSIGNDDNDREDEIEAARNAAINQEIKRVLTEVLLKVTDDLFDEIAQEMLEEDDGDIYAGKKETGDDRNGSTKSRLASPPPSSLVGPVPVPTARVVISSLKDGDRDDKLDSRSISSDTPVGNVLGLASYASDEEDVETSKGVERKVSSYEDKIEVKDGYVNQERIERKLVERGGIEVKMKEDGGKMGKQEMDDCREPSKENDGSKNSDSGGRKEVREFDRERRHREEEKIQLHEKKASSPEPPESYLQERVDCGNLTEHENVGGAKSPGLAAEEQHQGAGKDVKERPLQLVDARRGERERNSSRNKMPESAALEKESHKIEKKKLRNRHEVKEGITKKEEVVASKRERENKEVVDSHKIPGELSSGKEKKKDGKLNDFNTRKRGTDILGDGKIVAESERNTNREKRKEKSKEKGKEREKEHDRDKRRNVREKNERKGREKRTEIKDPRRVRRRSSSTSNRGRSATRSISSSSPDSRRRQHACRSSRHRSRSRSPGRFKKRRVSRSRSGSRSRSPHVKQFRRNSPSPSREKLRYGGSRSRSPVHRRRRS